MDKKSLRGPGRGCPSPPPSLVPFPEVPGEGGWAGWPGHGNALHVGQTPIGGHQCQGLRGIPGAAPSEGSGMAPVTELGAGNQGTPSPAQRPKRNVFLMFCLAHREAGPGGPLKRERYMACSVRPSWTSKRTVRQGGVSGAWGHWLSGRMVCVQFKGRASLPSPQNAAIHGERNGLDHEIRDGQRGYSLPRPTPQRNHSYPKKRPRAQRVTPGSRRTSGPRGPGIPRGCTRLSSSGRPAEVSCLGGGAT